MTSYQRKSADTHDPFDINLWNLFIGNSKLEIFISLCSLVIFILSCIDIYYTWNPPSDLPEQCNYKPNGWETTLGLVGLCLPFVLVVIKYIMIDRVRNNMNTKIYPSG